MIMIIMGMGWTVVVIRIRMGMEDTGAYREELEGFGFSNLASFDGGAGLGCNPH